MRRAVLPFPVAPPVSAHSHGLLQRRWSPSTRVNSRAQGRESVGAQLRLFGYVLSEAGRGQSWVVVARTGTPKIFTLWLFTGRVCQAVHWKIEVIGSRTQHGLLIKRASVRWEREREGSLRDFTVFSFLTNAILHIRCYLWHFQPPA